MQAGLKYEVQPGQLTRAIKGQGLVRDVSDLPLPIYAL